MTTVIVSGAIANKHGNGGATWTRLSWALGLRDLGCSVYFVEQLNPAHCVDAEGIRTEVSTSANLAYFDQVVSAFGLADRASLIDESRQTAYGLSIPELRDIASSADLLVNISGHLRFEEIVSRIRRKVYIDLDPGYTQCWNHADGFLSQPIAHDFFFTIGENIGTPRCPLPTDGIPWRPIRQPVVLDHWPIVESDPTAPFTTIASWRGPYGPVQCQGRTYGLKVHEFRRFIELPQRARPSFELALDIHPEDAADRDSLIRHGWSLADPRVVACDPMAFRHYVQGSAAEFSVAQGIYVDTSSGWFSDRTTRYLASGKPALVQDTGFSQRYPVGEGLLTFRSIDEAVLHAEDIVRDYPRHCRAAREIAETYFRSDVVLAEMLNQIELASPRESVR